MAQREIKFRFWNNKIKKMLPVTNLGFDAKNIAVNDAWLVGAGSLMQFTGLKDKNGQEIYEGDILQRRDDPDKHRWLVEYWVAGGCWISKDPDGTIEGGVGLYEAGIESSELYVVGNIYENPELLKKETP